MPVTRGAKRVAPSNIVTIDLESDSSSSPDEVSVRPGPVLGSNGRNVDSATVSQGTPVSSSCDNLAMGEVLPCERASRRWSGFGSKVVEVEVASKDAWSPRDLPSKPTDNCPSLAPVVENPSCQSSSPEAQEPDDSYRVREVVETESIPASEPQDIAKVTVLLSVNKPSRSPDSESLPDSGHDKKRTKRSASPPSEDIGAPQQDQSREPSPILQPVLSNADPASSVPDEGEDALGDSTEPLVLPPAPFHVVEDPNDYHVEEEAHLYHNPPLPSKVTEGVLPQNLAPLKPPPPPPIPPNTGNCSWSYDAENRLFLADFRTHAGPIDPIDERFMLEVMERDDLTLISDGLLEMLHLDRKLWTMENIAGTFLDEFYHKFRRFDSKSRDGTNIVVEVDNLCSMRMADYCAYLEKRARYLAGAENEGPDFSFEDHERNEHKLDVSVTALYCIDLDIKKNLKEMYDYFLENFRMPSILPGGQYCLMNKVTEDARPFMGPNCRSISC